MSSSIRFLGFAVLAWAGVRAASLGFFPGSTAVAAPANAAELPTTGLPPVTQTQFNPPPPLDPALPPSGYAALPPGYAPAYPPAYPPPQTLIVRAGWPANAGPPVQRSAYAGGWAGIAPTPQPLYYVPLSPDPWPRASSAPAPAARTGDASAPRALPSTPPRPPRFDRLQLSAWALLRGTRIGSTPATSLATGGTLGGSQAGARLTYRFTNAWAATLRSSSSVGGVRGAEVAAGVRWQPLKSIPVAFTAERREGLGRFGGRSAFALFVEGGIYHRALFRRLYLDGYVQGGVVGFRHRDLFVDGGATLTRPIWRNLSGGIGVWGAAQPGLYRLDAGPRLSMDVGRGIKVHADYRQRLVGNAAPPSGPALTLAADF
jgi:hypothetical protein